MFPKYYSHRNLEIYMVPPLMHIKYLYYMTNWAKKYRITSVVVVVLMEVN
jgi:hypothetical protein